MLIERMIRAARLDPGVYNELEQDQNANGQALAVVLIVAFCALIGSAITGHRTQSFIGAGLGEVIGWLTWSLIILVVGKILGGTADFGEVMRTLAFAETPGVFMFFASLPLLGPLVGLAVWIWVAVANVVAVREAMDFDTGRAVLTVIIPTIIMIILIALLVAVFGVALFAFALAHH
jgi:hypothetical protein